ncbi:hypothetical protein BGX24_008190 [Mortierella sp. AD032]|nr:hypothetical protein BGX24_008190 [Mortierella sp. AD032]
MASNVHSVVKRENNISTENSRPLDMTNIPPSEQHDLRDIDDGDSTNTTQRVRKRDKMREFLGIPKSKTKSIKNKCRSGKTPSHTPSSY